MSFCPRTPPPDFIEPYLPLPAKAPPASSGWIHEIKLLARRDTAGVRLITRHGNDLTRPFPFIALAVDKLPVRLRLIDGEAIVCDENGLAVFELIRGHRSVSGAVPCPSRVGKKIAEDPKWRATKFGPIKRRCGVTKRHSAIKSGTARSSLDEHWAIEQQRVN